MNRKIQDIAPLIADDFIDYEVDEKTLQEYRDLLEQEKGRLGLYYDYLPLLHDSKILKVDYTDSRFTLFLNDYTRYSMACALIDKKGYDVDKDKLEFPIEIDFEISRMSFNSVDKKGVLHKTTPVAPDILLYEQIIAFEKETMEVALVFLKENSEEEDEYILVLLTVKKIEVKELQDKSWWQYFDESSRVYLDLYKKELAKGTWISDQWVCEKLINEVDNS
ncbi:MAG: hypothetical protein R6U66_04055 [Bacteroidales bacterium]